MTSNVGARYITNQSAKEFGFAFSDESKQKENEFEKIKETVMGELKNTFRPEFLNRIDDIIVFQKLTDNEIEQIAKLMLNSLAKRLADIEISVTFTENAVKEIAKKGFDPVYGARPLRRAINTYIEDRISEEILQKNIQAGDSVECDFTDGKFTFSKK